MLFCLSLLSLLSFQGKKTHIGSGITYLLPSPPPPHLFALAICVWLQFNRWASDIMFVPCCLLAANQLGQFLGGSLYNITEDLAGGRWVDLKWLTL